ncbi:PIN domain-containing protein [Actinoallomurus purpureus]|uniref:PIN-like domain-containing protein n=1 Tax=Actinoallomurus purpureus TaxID=478114 RepID=UPI002093EAD6|nr:PIN domain-containing protein [Actinoallomurus purpureus]MCO6010553.1 PIN domain-containing protein [Actinoallomurus purpureus]
MILVEDGLQATSFQSLFQEYYAPSEEMRKRLILSGLVCLDANVMLDAYRFAPKAREELFRVLGLIGERLWVPHQAAFEFHRNRVKVIADHAKAYKEASEAIDELRNKFEESLTSAISALGKATALRKEEQERIVKPLAKALDRAAAAVEELREEHGISLDKMVANDPVRDRFEKIIGNKVGKPFDGPTYEEVRKEAGRRVNQKIPPGYADAKTKDDATGDYFLWRQILDEAAKRKLPILLVTRDKKEDWIRREKGRTISARPELIDEAKRVAGADLVILDTESFLYHARRYLGATVSDDFLEQVASLPPVVEVAPGRPEYIEMPIEIYDRAVAIAEYLLQEKRRQYENASEEMGQMVKASSEDGRDLSSEAKYRMMNAKRELDHARQVRDALLGKIAKTASQVVVAIEDPKASYRIRSLIDHVPLRVPSQSGEL